MTDGHVAAPRCPPRNLNELIVERPAREVLLPTCFVAIAPLGVPPRECRWLEVVENLDVLRRHVRIPLAGAAARDRDDAPRVHAITVLEPAEERDPVEDLEPDFGQPGPGDDWLPSARDGRQLALDPPLRLERGELLPQTTRTA